MTRPKFPLPDQTVLHRRHTLEGMCLFAPRPALNAMYGYIFALGCLESGQEVHAEVLAPDRRAGVLTDRTAKRSDFFESTHSRVAVQYGRKVLGRVGGSWDKHPPGDTVCLAPPAVEDALMEVWETVLRLNLVDKLADYPGFMILPDDWWETKTFRRPKGCPAHWPDEVTITPVPPPQYRDWPREEVRAYFNAKIRQMEREHQKRRRSAGIRTLGRGRCVSLNPFSRIDGRPTPSFPRWSGAPGLVDAARREFRDKRAQYDEGRERLKEGRLDALFPSGTFKIPRQVSVRVAPIPDRPLTVIHGVAPRARAPA